MAARAVPMTVGEDGRVSTTPANFVANRIYIKKDTPYAFDDRPFMATVFDDNGRHVLCKTARQVSKSTTIAGRLLCNTELYAPYTALYLSPSYGQTAKFSHQRLGPTIKQSPHLQVRMDEDCLDNVLEKEFIDGSLLYLSYAKDNADRARGLSVDEIDFDEVQDMVLDAVEPVVRESLFTSKWKKRFYSGTPKSLSNGIEKLWRESDQREWMVRCRKHAPIYHQKLTTKNVGKHGVICDRCGGPLNTLDGVWARTSTRTPEGRDPYIHGYHIPQIVFPTTKSRLPNRNSGFLDWDEFLLEIQDPKAEEATILNEKFGESADSASKPITEDQLRAICGDRVMPDEYQEYMTKSYTFAGVDWGAGLGSATAFVVGQFDPRNPDVYRILFCRRFDGQDADPETCVPEIMRLCRVFRVKRLHADWGSGLGINSRIMAEMGDDYLTTNYWSTAIGSSNVNYDRNLNRFVLNRSLTMTKFFQALKRQAIKIAFRWEDYQTYAKDILAVFREERKNGDPYFDHNPGEQDDFCHAHIYCWLIACWDRMGGSLGGDFLHEARNTGRSHNPSVN